MRCGLNDYLRRPKPKTANLHWYMYRIEHSVHIYYGYVKALNAEAAKTRLTVDDPCWRYPGQLEYCGIVSEEVVKQWVSNECTDGFNKGMVIRLESKHVSKSTGL